MANRQNQHKPMELLHLHPCQRRGRAAAVPDRYPRKPLLSPEVDQKV